MEMTTTRNETMRRMIALFVCCMMCFMVFFATSSQIAFCTEPTTAPVSGGAAADSIEGAVNVITETAYDIMRSIITPLCIVWVCYAGFQFLFGGQRGSDSARKTLIHSVVALVIVVFAPVLVKTVAEAFINQGTSDWSSYNPLG